MTRVPEVSELCAEMDCLIEFLERQAQMFSAHGAAAPIDARSNKDPGPAGQQEPDARPCLEQ